MTGLNKELNLDIDLFLVYLDGVCLEILLRAKHIQGLDARREMRPPDHLSGLDIKLGPVYAALNDAAVDQRSLFQRRKHMRAPALDGKKTILKMKDKDGLSINIEPLPAARRNHVFIAHKRECHDRSFPV